jgi:hypothetical protein
VEPEAPRSDECGVADDHEGPDEEQRADDPRQAACCVVEAVPASLERGIQLPHRVLVERTGRGRRGLDTLKRRKDAVDSRPSVRAVIAVTHSRPLLVDDNADVRTDGGANTVTFALRERAAVSHDGRKSIRLVGDIPLRVAVVLVRDHDDEREQQSEQRSDDPEHLRGDLRVESLGDCGDEPPNQPDEQENDADDRGDDRDQQKPDRHLIDDAAQHRQNRMRPDRRAPLGRSEARGAVAVVEHHSTNAALTRPAATASSSAR